MSSQVPHPQEERHLRVLGILRELVGDLYEGFLQNVGVVDPAGEATAETQVDHPLEAVAVGREQRVQGFLVAGGGPLERLGFAVFVVDLCVVHTF